MSLVQEKLKGDVKPVLQMQNVSAEKDWANNLPCPLSVRQESMRLIGVRDTEGRKLGSAGAYRSGFNG